MSKIYKRLIIVLSVCFLLVTGLFVVSVSAADVNWLAVKYENKQTRAFLGEKIVLPETKPVYPQKVASYFYVVESPDGKTVMVEDDDFFVEKEGTYKVYICVVGNDGSTYSEYYSVTAEKSSAPV